MVIVHPQVIALPPDLTDTEVDNLCAGLTQNAAKVRYLEGLGLKVRRRPNGRPLVGRAHFEAVMAGRAVSVVGDELQEPNWSN